MAAVETLFDVGAPVVVGNTHGLTQIQRAILAHVGRHGHITPALAGPYAHSARIRHERGHAGGYDGSSCCQYGSKDGLESIKRLVDRGLLVRVARGRYEAP